MQKEDVRRLPSYIGKVFDASDLKEAERLFEWALSYERKGLKIAADALRDEGRKAYDRYIASATKRA